jgi:RimJ/RimL family protein N-acetyltransferase
MKTTWIHGSEKYRYATPDDLPDFVEMLTDPEVGRWLWFTPIPPEGVEEFFTPFLETQAEQLKDGEVPQTAVFSVEDHSNSFLGQGAVVAVEGSPGGFEIGFQLTRKAWGRGVGSRLALFLCSYAIHHCDAYRIEAGCLDGNAGSQKISRNLGLNLEGTRPGYRLRDGVRHTELQFGAEVHELDSETFKRTAREVGMYEEAKK